MQLEESNQVHGQQLWEHNNNLLNYERQQEVQPPMHGGNGFFHPLDAAGEPTLHIGYHSHPMFEVNFDIFIHVEIAIML
jgi:hypothetical protein